MSREIEYINHTCSNKNCECAFIDVDLFNDQDASPNWRYCPQCAKSKEQMIPKELLKDKKFLKILYQQATQRQLIKKLPVNYKVVYKDALEIYSYVKAELAESSRSVA